MNETVQQGLWIEANKEWFQSYGGGCYYLTLPRTQGEANLMLQVLFNLCEDIKKPNALTRAALSFGAEITRGSNLE